MALDPGLRLGRYEIRSQLGAGGMGEVYLAEDTTLHRLVAVKVLASNYTHNEEQLRRFEREAYAASSLNHPNIVTIYEIGFEADLHFIVTEHVIGESLRHHIRHHQMELRGVIDVAIQVASALTAAHETGIVHRDVKPENIMIRPDGYVKVLDFGLAKLALEVEAVGADTEASTQLLLKTEPGRVMGTINYMSPEQVRGQEVDARTDIFSLGVVLYEMLAGRRPFSGDTKSDTLAAILMVEPRPLIERFPNLPAELNRILGKALKKNREERYQTAKELVVDLKSLRQELEFEAKTGRPIILVPAEQPRAPQTGELAQASTARQPEGALTISELFINEVKSHPKRTTATLVVVALMLAIAGVGVFKLVRLAQRPESFQSMRLTKSTFAGNVVDRQVAISPDGKYLAYATKDQGQQSLWVRHLATSSEVQLVPARAVRYDGLIFSRDGNYIYYVVVEEKDLGSLFKIAALGGAPRRLIENADGPVSLSPDGDRVAFLRENRLLMIANSDGTDVKTFATATIGKLYDVPAWSPNGEVIVCGLYSSADNSRRLVSISVKDGQEKPIASPNWLSLPGIMWVPDGTGLLLNARDLDTKLLQIWHLGYPDGQLRRITNDLSNYIGVSLTADGKTLASVQTERLSNIWSLPLGNVSQARRLTFEAGKDDGLTGLSWSPDNRIVYNARMTGVWDLWIINDDGTNNRQLTFNTRNNVTPTVTPDGKYIVFVSNRSGKDELWRTDLDGGNPLQLTQTPGFVGQPTCSPDGKWVIHQVIHEKKATLWKISVDGGTPVQLTNEESGRAAVSPDGTLIACDYGEARPGSRIKLAIISMEGGPPLKIMDLPLVIKSPNFRWTPDGGGFIYIDSVNRVYNLWSQSIDGSPPKQLTDFSSDQIFRFDLAPDGKKIALSRGHDASDAVLITNFR